MITKQASRLMVFKRYMLILIAALAAVILLTLSWPRLKASIRYLPVDTAIANYWKDGQFNHGQLAGLVERAEQAIAIHDHYRYWAGLSELYILRGQDMDQSIWVRREALEKSITAAAEVVRRAPSQPRSWLRIARARDFLAYPAENVIPPLKMSILTGRFEPTIMLTRLELGLRHLPVLDRETMGLLRDQAVLSWTNQQRPMLQRIKSGTLNFERLREVLSSNNQAIIAEIEVLLVQ